MTANGPTLSTYTFWTLMLVLKFLQAVVDNSDVS